MKSAFHSSRTPMPALLDDYPLALADWLAERNQPPYRRRQINRWLFGRRAGSFAEMSDLPISVRNALADKSWGSDIVADKKTLAAHVL